MKSMENDFRVSPLHSSVLRSRNARTDFYFICQGSFHGRTLGALSCTRSKAIHKLDIPAFDWPMADFPDYLYPLEANVDYNQKQDTKCLAQVEDIMRTRLKEDRPVAGRSQMIRMMLTFGTDVAHSFVNLICILQFYTYLLKASHEGVRFVHVQSRRSINILLIKAADGRKF